MKTIATRIRLEKHFWLDMARMLESSGFMVKWEIAGSPVSRQKIWQRIHVHHSEGLPAYYGLSVCIDRIGNHDILLCLEMQDTLKLGLRFREGFRYWTENEIEEWGDLTIRLDNVGSWNLEAPGWFAVQKHPISLNFTDPSNSAMIDLFFYKHDSYARAILKDQLRTAVLDVKKDVVKKGNKKIWSL